MSHLSRDERLLAIDGALDAARQRHLAGCAACRTDVETLGGVLARVRAVDVPEPSPLFWDHLARRVGDAIAREPAPTRAWWSPRLAWVVAAVVLSAAGAGYLTRPQPQPPTPVAAHVALASAAPDRLDAAPAVNLADVLPSIADDGSWALIAAVADQAADDDAFAPQVGQAELSMSALTADERKWLARELAAELTPARKREG